MIIFNKKDYSIICIIPNDNTESSGIQVNSNGITGKLFPFEKNNSEEYDTIHVKQIIEDPSFVGIRYNKNTGVLTCKSTREIKLVNPGEIDFGDPINFGDPI